MYQHNLMDGYYRIRIPNEEVKKEFKNIIDYYLSLGDGQLNRLMRYLILNHSILVILLFHHCQRQNKQHNVDPLHHKQQDYLNH